MKPLQEGIKKKIGPLLGQSRSYAFSSSLLIRAAGTLFYAAQVGVALWTIIFIPQFAELNVRFGSKADIPSLASQL